MSHPLAHVVPGQPFAPRADTHNALVDAARAFHEQRTIFGVPAFTGGGGSDWILAQVDSSGHPTAGQVGFGTKHCKRLRPATGLTTTTTLPSPTFTVTTEAIRYCIPWTGTVSDIPNGSRVWIMSYEGVNVIMLVQC